MIADYGIFLEIVGFILYLISAKKPPHKGGGSILFEGLPTASLKWKKFYYEMSGDKAQFCRLVAIFFISLGLALQHSKIHNWFLNNYPQI